MNKKLIVIAMVASFIMIGASMVSAVNNNTIKEQKNKNASPLFKIRSKQALYTKHGESLITRIFGERLFLNSFPIIGRLIIKKTYDPEGNYNSDPYWSAGPPCTKSKGCWTEMC